MWIRAAGGRAHSGGPLQGLEAWHALAGRAVGSQMPHIPCRGTFTRVQAGDSCGQDGSITEK